MDGEKPKPDGGAGGAHSCRSIDWYAEGQARVIEVDGVRVTVQFVGRKGRRARIAITAPPGSAFRAAEGELPGDSLPPTSPQ